MAVQTYMVPKIRCEGCAAAITEALAGMDGIDDVAVDTANRTVTVRYDETETSEVSIRTALADAGYPAQ